MFAGHQVPDRGLPRARADDNLLQREAVDRGRVPRRAPARVPARGLARRPRRAAAARAQAPARAAALAGTHYTPILNIFIYRFLTVGGATLRHE